jgi:hypothetical protein
MADESKVEIVAAASYPDAAATNAIKILLKLLDSTLSGKNLQSQLKNQKMQSSFTTIDGNRYEIFCMKRIMRGKNKGHLASTPLLDWFCKQIYDKSSKDNHVLGCAKTHSKARVQLSEGLNLSVQFRFEKTERPIDTQESYVENLLEPPGYYSCCCSILQPPWRTHTFLPLDRIVS